MNWRYTLALAVLAVLAVGLALSQRKAEPVDYRLGTATATPVPMVTLEPGDVEEVHVADATGGYTLTLEAGGWQVDGKAASDDVKTTVENLAKLQVSGEVRAGAKPEDYGFATPTLTVTLKTKAGEERTLLYGDPVPTQYGSVYVMIKGESRIAWVSDYDRSKLVDWVSSPPLAPTPTPGAGAGPTATVVPMLPPDLGTVLPQPGGTEGATAPTEAAPTEAAPTEAAPTEAATKAPTKLATASAPKVPATKAP